MQHLRDRHRRRHGRQVPGASCRVMWDSIRRSSCKPRHQAKGAMDERECKGDAEGWRTRRGARRGVATDGLCPCPNSPDGAGKHRAVRFHHAAVRFHHAAVRFHHDDVSFHHDDDVKAHHDVCAHPGGAGGAGAGASQVIWEDSPRRGVNAAAGMRRGGYYLPPRKAVDCLVVEHTTTQALAITGDTLL
jgi:hypothetical protein